MELGRSTDNLNYETIFIVGGTCGFAYDSYYDYTDSEMLVAGTTYFYRVTASGGFYKSDTASIQFISAGENDLLIYPVPAQNEVNIIVDNRFTPSFLVELYSFDGKPLYRSIENYNLFSISLGPFSGQIAFIRVNTEEGHALNKKIIVQ
jgi:hypothetical protein